MKKTNNKVQIFLEVAFLSCLVLQFGTVWTAFLSTRKVFTISIYLVEMITLFFLLLVCPPKRNQVILFFQTTLLVGLFFLVFFSLSRGTDSIAFIRFCIVCFFVISSFTLHFLECIAINDPLKLLSNIIICYSFISLFLWLFVTIGVLRSNTIYYSTWGITNYSSNRYTSFFSIFFITNNQYINLFGNLYYRNIGIFNEAPLYSFVLCFSLLYELFIKGGKKRTKSIFVLCLTLITTFSFTGYIIMLVAFFFYFLLKKTKTEMFIFKAIVSAIIFLLVSSIIFYLLVTKSSTASWSDRLDDFRIGFLIWLDHPIIGIGYSNSIELTRFISFYRNHNPGFSNSLMLILAYGGLYLFLPYLFLIGHIYYIGVKLKSSKIISFITLFSVMLIFTNAAFYGLTIFVLTFVSSRKYNLIRKKYYRGINYGWKPCQEN